MKRLRKHVESTRQRIFLSVLCMAGFALVATLRTINQAVGQDAWFFAMIAPFALAFVLLPRNVLLASYPDPASPEESDELDMLRNQLQALHGRTIGLRLVYMLMLIGFAVLLPMLGV